MICTILLIFTVTSLTFVLSVYLRLGGILSGSYLISFATLIYSSFSSSLHLSISTFFTNTSYPLEMNKRDMFSAAAHSRVLIQPQSIVPPALPVEPAYSRCVQLFSGHSPELLHCNFFIPISFLFLQFLCL